MAPYRFPLREKLAESRGKLVLQSIAALGATPYRQASMNGCEAAKNDS